MELFKCFLNSVRFDAVISSLVILSCCPTTLWVKNLFLNSNLNLHKTAPCLSLDQIYSLYLAQGSSLGGLMWLFLNNIWFFKSLNQTAVAQETEHVGDCVVLDSLQDESSWKERMVSTTHGVWTASTQRVGVEVVFCQIRAAAFVFHFGLVWRTSHTLQQCSPLCVVQIKLGLLSAPH